jgi:MinD-like ATPase involved in chromosome partitioning or flagellar assembly
MGGEKAAQDLKVPFLGRIPIDPDMVTDCDRGMPFVMSYPKSDATKALRQIADRCKEYVGLNETRETAQKEELPYHCREQHAKR